MVQLGRLAFVVVDYKPTSFDGYASCRVFQHIRMRRSWRFIFLLKFKMLKLQWDSYYKRKGGKNTKEIQICLI